MSKNVSTSTQPAMAGHVQMSTIQLTALGALAGMLPNLALYATQGATFIEDTDGLGHLCARTVVSGLLGAIVVYFMGDRKTKHIFSYGICAPLIIISLMQSYKFKHEAVDAKAEKEVAVKERLEAVSDKKELKKVYDSPSTQVITSGPSVNDPQDNHFKTTDVEEEL